MRHTELTALWYTEMFKGYVWKLQKFLTAERSIFQLETWRQIEHKKRNQISSQYDILLTDPALHPCTRWGFHNVRRVHSNVQTQDKSNAHCFHLQFNKNGQIWNQKTRQRAPYISHGLKRRSRTHSLFHSPCLCQGFGSFNQLLVAFLHETQRQLPVYYLAFVLIAEQIVVFGLVS